VSWHGRSGERFAIEHRVSASDVIRQLEATGPSREHPGRAFSEWTTIHPEMQVAIPRTPFATSTALIAVRKD
jgi:hypothetical protein